MHQDAAFSAIRRTLVRLLPDLPETAGGRVEIENMAPDIMKSLDEDGPRFVSANED